MERGKIRNTATDAFARQAALAEEDHPLRPMGARRAQEVLAENRMEDIPTIQEFGEPLESQEGLADPHRAYPHPQSLQSPVALVPEGNSGEDIAATQYVTAKAGELRVMNAHGA